MPTLIKREKKYYYAKGINAIKKKGIYNRVNTTQATLSKEELPSKVHGIDTQTQ